MDAIAQLQETDIGQVLQSTYNIFVPLLEPKREEITRARNTFKYGETERHQLDVYYPPHTGSETHPLLVFVYGGGFVTGERAQPAPADLIYGNVGQYFASRGFVTIIPDYRLAPATTYPGPAFDIRDALAWAASHASELGPGADIDRVFIFGHSAGGVHVMTLLLEPTVLADAQTSALLARIKGAVIVSSPFSWVKAGSTSYFNGRELEAAPLPLLRAASEEVVKGLPPLALITCELDPEFLKVAVSGAQKALGERGIEVPVISAGGHNHISVTVALGSGQGERWAEESLKWIDGL